MQGNHRPETMRASSSSVHEEVARVLFKTPTRSQSYDENISYDDEEEDATIDYSAFDRTTIGSTSAEGETTFNGDGDDTEDWDGQTTRGSEYYYHNGDEISTHASAFTLRTEQSHGNSATESRREGHEEETNATDSEYDDSTDVSRPQTSMWRADEIKAYFQRMSRSQSDDGYVSHSCHEALMIAPRDALKQLFDYRAPPTEPHQTPTSIATTPATEVTSNTTKETLTLTRQIESLQRECNTLKEIIDGDSKHILLLKAEIQNVRDKGGTEKYGNVVLEKEIMDLRDRERSLLETVEALQKNLSLGNQLDDEASIAQSKGIQRLQFQCQMFSFQIVELEKENHELITENEKLRRDLSLMTTSNAKDQVHEITPTKHIQLRPMESLRAQVSSLVDKFSEIEEDMNRREKARDEQSRTLQALESLEDSSTIPFVYSSSDISTPDKVVGMPHPITDEKDQHSFPVDCSQEEDVEVTLDGLIIATSRSEDPQQIGNGPGLSSNQSSTTGSAFCGCLNSSSD